MALTISRQVFQCWRKVFCLGLVMGMGHALAAVENTPEEQKSGAPGVNPKDNITKTELFFTMDELHGGVSVKSLAFKYDLALNAKWGTNVELPLTRLTGPGVNASGLGEARVRVRHVTTSGRLSTLSAFELVAPTANHDALGRGRWQANPVVGWVYAFNPMLFVFAGYKHQRSVGGSSRPDMDESQPRVLLARIWPQGVWALADAKYTRSWTTGHLHSLDFECELGRMVGSSTGVWLRAGTSSLDSDRRFGVLLGVRRIW